MSHALLDPGDLPFLLLSQPSSAHLADLAWVAGDVAQSRTTYERAWENADSDALVTLVALDHVSSIPNQGNPLGRRASEIEQHVDAGRLSRKQATELLYFIILLAAYRLHDFQEAARLALQSSGRFEIDPILFVGLKAVEHNKSVWRNSLNRLMTRAKEESDENEQTRLLILSAMIGAEIGPGKRGKKKPALPESITDSPLLDVYHMLRALDEERPSLTSSDGRRLDEQELLSRLLERVDDEAERFVYRCRKWDALAQSGSKKEAAEGFESLLKTQQVGVRSLVRERCQRAAAQAKNYRLASEMATTRAQRSDDSTLKTCLFLRAEEFHRMGRAGPDEIVHVSREMADLARRIGGEALGVLAHAHDVLEAIALQSGEDDQVLAVWDERALNEQTETSVLRRMLFRRRTDDLMPSPSDVSAFLDRVSANPTNIALRTALSLSFIGEGWRALSKKLSIEGIDEQAALKLNRLGAFVSIFRRDDHATGLAVLEEAFSKGDTDPATIWGIYEASHHSDTAEQWQKAFSKRRGDCPDRLERAHLAAAEAALLAESDQTTDALRLAQSTLKVSGSNPALELVISRIGERTGEYVAVTEQAPLVTIRGTEQLRPEAAEFVTEADRLVVSGKTDEAIKLLVDAATSSSKNDTALASTLLVQAATIQIEQDVQDSKPEALLSQALGFQPSNIAAWSGLCRVHSANENHDEVAQLLQSIPAGLSGSQAPVDALRRTGTVLKEQNPILARDVFDLLVRLSAELPIQKTHQNDLDDLFELSRRTEQIPRFRDLLEDVLAKTSSESYRGELNLRLGVVFVENLRDVDLAVEHLRRALNARATRERSSQLLRNLLEEQQRWEELVEVLLTMAEFILDVDERVEILMQSAEILWDHLNRPQAAADALQMLLRSDSKHLLALRRLAEYHASNEEWTQAVSHLESAARLVENRGERSLIYQKLGELYQIHLERPDLALENYLTSFICDSTNRETFDRLDRLYTATDRHKEQVGLINIAVEATQKAPKEAPFELESLFSRRARIEFTYLDKPGQAAESLVEALTVNPSNEEHLRLLESHLMEKADPDTVLRAYEIHASAFDPDSPELIDLVRSQALFCDRFDDRAEQSIDYYRRLLDLDSSDISAFTRLERYYRKRKEWDSIIALYRRRLKWVTRPEETVSIYHKIARIYEAERRDLESAADTYRTLLKLIPSSISALRGLGRLYEALRRWDDLIEVSEHEVKLAEDDRIRAHLLFKIGSIYETNRNEESRALTYYERAVENDPKCVPALHGLRDIFRRRNEPKRVIEYLQREAKVWDSPRERASIHTRIAEVEWIDLGRAAEAIKNLRRALDLVPDSAPALHRLLEIHFAEENWAEAAPIAHSLSQHPESIRSERRGELFLQRGVIAHHLGNRREAIDCLKIVLDISSDCSEAFDLLADILNEEGDADAHAEFFAQLQREFVERDDSAGLARVKRFLGRQAENRLDPTGAQSAYQEAIELDPESIAGLRDLVRVLIRNRSFSDAFDEAMAFADNSETKQVVSAAKVIAARILLDHLDRLKDARKLLADVLDEEPELTEALFLDAQAAYLNEDWLAARQAMKKLVEIDSTQRETLNRADQAEHFFYLGRICEVGFDDLENAIQYYARARELCATDPRPLKAAALILYRQENWQRLDRLVDRALMGAAALGGDEATTPFLFLAAKLSKLRELDDRSEEYVKRLLKIAPNHHEARVLLVEVVQHGEEGSQRASQELETLIDTDVFDVAALSGLANIKKQRGLMQQARCFFEVLDLIDHPIDDDDKPIADEPATPLATDKLSQELLSTYVNHPILDSAYLKALRIVAPKLVAQGLIPSTAPPVGAQVLEDHETKQINSILSQVEAALPAAQGKLRCLREGPRGTAVSVILDPEPAALVEMDCQLDDQEKTNRARFLLAHAAHLMASDGYLVVAVPRSDLIDLFFGISQWRPSLQGPPPSVESVFLRELDKETLAALRDHLVSRSSRIEPLSDPQHAQRFVIALEEAVVESADRFGLVLCGNLNAAVDCLMQIEWGVGLEHFENKAEELPRSERVVHLVKYSVSDNHFSLKAELSELAS